MSRYITQADVVGRYPSVSKKGGEDEIGSSYIDYAEVEIEGRLVGYTKPFSSNNLTVKDLCIDLVYAKTLVGANDEKAKEIRSILDDRIERLNTGMEEMVTTSGTTIGQDTEKAWSEFEGYYPVFGMGNVEDLSVDSGQMYDEEQERL